MTYEIKQQYSAARSWSINGREYPKGQCWVRCRVFSKAGRYKHDVEVSTGTNGLRVGDGATLGRLIDTANLWGSAEVERCNADPSLLMYPEPEGDPA